MSKGPKVGEMLVDSGESQIQETIPTVSLKPDHSGDVSLDAKVCSTLPIGAPKMLYHGTSTTHLASIQASMSLASGYYGSRRIAEYYAEEVCDEVGGRPVLIGIPIERFDCLKLAFDRNSLDEPLTYTLGVSEEDVWDEWQAAEQQDWLACYNIVESVRYNGSVELQDNDFIF